MARSLLSHFVLWHSKHTAFASRSSAHQSHERWGHAVGGARWWWRTTNSVELATSTEDQSLYTVFQLQERVGLANVVEPPSFCTRGVLFIFVPHLEGRLPSATSVQSLQSLVLFCCAVGVGGPPLWFRRTSASGSLQNEPASLPHVLFLCCVGCNAWFRRVCCDARHESINNSW